MRSQESVEESGRIFTELISLMEKKRSEVMELIRAQEKAELSRAERLLKKLEQEIADLKRRVTELEQLSHTHDHVHFLQSFPSLCLSPGFENSLYTVNLHHTFDGMRESLLQMKRQVEQIRPQAVALFQILPSQLTNRQNFLH
ncbi:tripartite motif-containing protein 16-like, partial [Clarias magur]